MNITETVKQLILEPLKKEGISIYEITYQKEDGNYFLRIVIDTKEGVDLDTCIKATNIINPILDSNNLEIDNYILDVCSKGGN